MNPSTVLYVVPVYNAALWLEESIQSIVDQDYPEIYIYCVDDGSTDDSVSILCKYEALIENFSFVEQENAGPGAAFNRGLQFAKEKGYHYIARMDADDISLPFRTRKQVEVLEGDESLAACGASASYFSEESEHCGSSIVPISSEAIRKEINEGGRGLIQGTTIFRTSALLNIGGYRTHKTPAEDTDIFLRLSENFELGNIPDIAYRIRICGSSHSLGNIYSTRLYHHYYLHLASLRDRGLKEDSYDDYVKHLSGFEKLSVRREAVAMSAYFRWMTKRVFPALAFAALLEPRRTVRRITKKLARDERGNKAVR